MGVLYWCGTSLDDLRAFPKIAKISLGRELDRLERGAVPTDFKPLKHLGKGENNSKALSGISGEVTWA